MRKAVFSMEMASAVFPFLHIKIMPNRPNTILKVTIKVVKVETLTILDTFLFSFLHFIAEVFKPLKNGWIVIFFPHTFYKRFHLLPCSGNGKKLIN